MTRESAPQMQSSPSGFRFGQMEGGGFDTATNPSAGEQEPDHKNAIDGFESHANGFNSTPLLFHHRHPTVFRQFLTPTTPTGFNRPGTTGSSHSYHTVRNTAALQPEERQMDWSYSRPIVALDIVWNFAFVLVAVSVLLSTGKERPVTPIRAWISGYSFQCLLHVGFVLLEYRRRRRRSRRRREEVGEERWVEYDDDGVVGVTVGDENWEADEEWRQGRITKKLESMNVVISFLWWIIGFYWIVIGGQTLLQDAPRLYWLTVVFLAFDVFFAVFCILLACFIGIALCCCLPCIITFLYAVAGQEGASDSDISLLPRFRFHQANRSDSSQEAFNLNRVQDASAVLTELDSHIVSELTLPSDDSECCICLAKYEDGVELHSLPCNHHFHTGCIIRWLRINATCPLCKYNILEGDDQV